LVAPTTDFGDHPAFAAASQIASTLIRIGAADTDTEFANPSNGLATADNTTGSNDEDLTMPAFRVGSTTALSIPVTLTAASLVGSTSRINVFADWNGDGDVFDLGETQTVQSAISSGTRTFNLTPPVGTIAGTKFLRIRITEGSTAPAFSGTSSLRGEVEDYAIVVNPAITDFGDWNGLGAATTTTSRSSCSISSTMRSSGHISRTAWV
jgi:hypothetical protein